MKKCFFKVYKNLYIYNKNEFNILIKKLINNNNFNKNNICNYSKTFCFETGVKRSIYNFFNLSRWNLKKLLIKTEICGLKKISW